MFEYRDLEADLLEKKKKLTYRGRAIQMRSRKTFSRISQHIFIHFITQLFSVELRVYRSGHKLKMMVLGNDQLFCTVVRCWILVKHKQLTSLYRCLKHSEKNRIIWRTQAQRPSSTLSIACRKNCCHFWQELLFLHARDAVSTPRIHYTVHTVP